MFQARRIRWVRKDIPRLERADVCRFQPFGKGSEAVFDPFLLLEEIHGETPADYSRGFDWHFHRGMESVSYILRGEMCINDSRGGQETLSAGDVQWITAGSGILHQEMPRGDFDGRMGGFQLWINLPGAQKMAPPSCQTIREDQIPLLIGKCHERIRVICGEIEGQAGPVNHRPQNILYLDVNIPACTQVLLPTSASQTVIAYVYKGSANFDRESGEVLEDRSLILFDEGDSVLVSTGAEAVRFLFLAGTPLHEPVAWRGSIVMNTEAELAAAEQELQPGTLSKEPPDLSASR